MSRLLLAAAVAIAAATGCSDDAAASAASDASATDSAKAVTFKASYPVNAAYPEGGAYDLSGAAFYVGSLDDGSVHRIDAATGVDTTLFVEPATGTWWTLGMDVDHARRRLWVCAMDDRKPGPRAGSIWVFDLLTGQRIANHALAAAAADATCTDVTVAADGVGYVVDREQPNVYAVDVAKGPTLFASGPALKGTFAGQNAVVLLPDASALLVVVYAAPKLVRVGLADKAVAAVAIDGTFADDALLAGADGLAFADDSAYVMFSSKLVRVTPQDADWQAATATSVAVAEGMTDVIATPGGLYLLNGQAVRFALGQPSDPFALARFDGAF